MRAHRPSGDARSPCLKLRSPPHSRSSKATLTRARSVAPQQLLLVKKRPRRSEDHSVGGGALYGVPVGLALLLYLNTLPAGFVYDDHRAVVNNPDVVGTSSWSSVFGHDFWGAPLQRKGSHGSWRPLTTLSFRLNALLSGAVSSEAQRVVPPSASWHFHATNVALHAVATGAYVALLRAVGVARVVCLWAGTLFAAHPVHVEAVGGVVGRAELLAAIAFCSAVGAYVFYLRGRRCGQQLHAPVCSCMKPYYKDHEEQSGLTWLWASVGATFVGVLCKEQAVTGLGVALVLHLVLVINTFRNSIFRNVVREMWLPCALTGLLVWWRVSLGGGTPSFTIADNPAAHATSPLTRALSVGRYWALHARLLLRPDVLSFDWSMGAVPLVSSFADIEALPLVFLLLGGGALTYKTARQLLWDGDGAPHESCQDALNNNASMASGEHEVPPPTHVAFALALLAVPFLPASNLVAWVGFVAAERVLYLPSMGASLLIALGAQCLTIGLANILSQRTGTPRLKTPNYKKQKRKKVLRVVNLVWVVLVLFMAARTVRRNLDWRSDETLYESGVAVCPAKAFANLGVVYSDQGRNKEAEIAYRSALKHAPHMADTHYNLGLLLMNLNRPKEALVSFHEALRSRPWLAQAHLSLSSTLMQLGQTKESMAVLETCIKHSNAPAKDGMSHIWAVTNCHQRLCRLKIQEGDAQSAIEELQTAIASCPPGYPKHSLLTLLAEAFVAIGDHAEAQHALNKALNERPGDVPAHLAFSRLLLANGSRTEDAEYWVRRAVALAPNDAHAHKHLGQLLLEQGRPEAAIDHWLRATTLDPSDHTAVFNSATALRLAGRIHQAETFYKKAVQIQPRDVSSQRNLGAILHLNGKLEEALHHYETALILAPGDPQTTTNLSRLRALLSKKGLL